MSATAEVLEITEGEDEPKTMPFTERLPSGVTITSVTSVTADLPTGAAALTFGTVVLNSTSDKVQFVVTAPSGSGGFRYHVTVTVLCSDGHTRKECKDLDVLEC